MRRAPLLCLTVMVASLMTGCLPGHLVYLSGPYRGRVVDAETKAPVEGAVVLVVWNKYIPVGAHPPKVFVDALEVLTGVDGEFMAPRQTHVVLYGVIDEPGLVIYSPGYAPYSSTAYEPRYFDVQLAKSKTREERIRRADLSLYVDREIPRTEVPNLIRLLNRERKELGLDPIGD